MRIQRARLSVVGAALAPARRLLTSTVKSSVQLHDSHFLARVQLRQLRPSSTVRRHVTTLSLGGVCMVVAGSNCNRVECGASESGARVTALWRRRAFSSVLSVYISIHV
jgi:hypothetical protein